MKRMHIGVTVDELERSIDFYTRLFGEPPTLQRANSAKWLLDDPLLNFAINTTGDHRTGVDHVGIQVESNDALERMRRSWDDSGLTRQDQDDLVCGYQHQDKSWVFDPQQVPWEVFVTHGVTDDYGTNEMPTT